MLCTGTAGSLHHISTYAFTRKSSYIPVYPNPLPLLSILVWTNGLCFMTLMLCAVNRPDGNDSIWDWREDDSNSWHSMHLGTKEGETMRRNNDKLK